MSTTATGETARPIAWSGKDVCICGVGARTSLGMSAPAVAAAVRAGISGITVHPEFLDKAGEPMLYANDELLDAQLALPQRIGQLLISVIAEALDDAANTTRDLRMSCWLALPEPRAGVLPHELLNAIQPVFTNFRLPQPQLLLNGHAAGLMALQAAAQHIAADTIDLALVAGVDSYVEAKTLTALDQRGWLMSATNRNGFPPGEGAGACLLARRNVAGRLGLPVLGGMVAASTAVEPIPIHDTDRICNAVALTAVIRAVVSGLGLPQQEITATYCDLNGQRYRNEEFLYALLRTQEAFVDAHDYLCPADCWGDVGAACGPLFVALAALAAQRRDPKAARALLWAGSESGYRSAVLLGFEGDKSEVAQW